MRRVVIGELARIVGAGNVSTDPADLECYSYDASGLSSVPGAVVLPGSVTETAEILTLAAAENIAVFPRGAGSGTTGGSLPSREGMVLCLTRMNRILSVRKEDLAAEVEPGVVTGEFQDAVSDLGLFYPPDPASLRFCTLGGNVATGAGGARAVKYGVTRDYVMALTVVLPGGAILETGAKTAKGVVGYDLTRLMVGSEGTLGIVGQITLRLIPGPEAVGTLLAFFPTAAAASEAVLAVFGERILPRCAEFLDRMSIVCVSDQFPEPPPRGSEAMLLMEVDGGRESIAPQLEAVTGCCVRCGAIRVHRAGSGKEAEGLWKARRGLSPAIRRLGFPDKVSEDVCVPRHALPALLENIEEIGRRNRVTVLNFGHAGDGNLHVNILLDRSIENDRQRGDAAVREIMAASLALGGTISGEHGVGLTKRGFIDMEIAPKGLEIMGAIKRVFDPQNILNPGKIFP